MYIQHALLSMERHKKLRLQSVLLNLNFQNLFVVLIYSIFLLKKIHCDIEVFTQKISLGRFLGNRCKKKNLINIPNFLLFICSFCDNDSFFSLLRKSKFQKFGTSGFPARWRAGYNYQRHSSSENILDKLLELCEQNNDYDCIGQGVIEHTICHFKKKIHQFKF